MKLSENFCATIHTMCIEKVDEYDIRIYFTIPK